MSLDDVRQNFGFPLHTGAVRQQCAIEKRYVGRVDAENIARVPQLLFSLYALVLEVTCCKCDDDASLN